MNYESKIILDLQENGLNIKNYGQDVRSNLKYAIIAMKQNYLAYDYLDESLKLNDTLINIYWEGYIQDAVRPSEIQAKKTK